MSEKNAPARIIESVGARTVSRRTVARGIAWTTPVVAVATAAPAFAVSRVPPNLEYIGACKYPGNSCKEANKGYAFAFTVTNNDARAVTFCDATLVVNEPSPFEDDVTFTYVGGCITVGGGQSGTAYFYFEGSDDSANSPFTGSLTATYANDCGSCDESAMLPAEPITVTATPPGGLCDCDATFIPS